MNKLKLIVVTAGFFVGVGIAVQTPQAAFAAPADQVQEGVNKIGGNEAGAGGSLQSMIKTAVNVLLFITGALAVLMIVFGGIKYVTSRGEATEVASAKNTILYAVVGIIVALLAYAVVSFVVGKFQSRSNPAEAGNAAGEAARDAAERARQEAQDKIQGQ